MRDQNNFFSTFFSSPINCAATAVVLGLACYALYHYNEGRKRAIAAQAAQPSASASDVSSQPQTSTRPATRASSHTIFQTPTQTNPQPATSAPLTTQNLPGTKNAKYFTQAGSVASNLGSEYDGCEIEVGNPGDLKKEGTAVYPDQDRAPTPK